jgi:hypothetical protein
MSILANDTVRTAIQIVLAIVIIVLGYVLFETIRGPARVFEAEQAVTQESRLRMDLLRQALMVYERQYEGYPSTLDSLAYVIERDSFFVANRETIFRLPAGRTLPPADTLIHAMRGPRFQYHVAQDDTTNQWIYLLRNPVTGDSIGSSDPTRVTGIRHAASWE